VWVRFPIRLPCGSILHHLRGEILFENRIFFIPLAFDAAVRGGGPCRNSVMTFGTEKLEWCGYRTVKKSEDTIIRFDTIHERDRQTGTLQTARDGTARRRSYA